MTLAAPAALWGLLAIPLLILLSFWRMRPARVTVSSIALWKRLPPNVPPVRSLRRPTWSLLLAMQILAVTAAVAALAKPTTEATQPGSRRIAVVVDTGARAFLDRVNAELDAILAATAADDVVMIEVPAMWRGPLARVTAKLDYIGSPEPAIELARAEGRRVVFVGDRESRADVNVLTGALSENVGVVDLAVEGDATWVKLLNLGPERDVRVKAGGREETWRIAAGESSRTFTGEPRIELLIDDGFALDNIAAAESTGRIDVELRGDAHANLRRAIEVQPRARIVDRSGEFVVSVGADAPEPSLVIAPPRGATFAPGDLSVQGLAKGTKAEDWRLEDAADLGPGWTPIVSMGTRVIVGQKGRKIVVNASLGRFPLTPAFPIFIANVLESVRPGGGPWVVRRSGASAAPGAWLLNVEASRLGRERRPFRVEDLGPAPPAPVRTEWSAVAAIGAALLMLGAWALERREER